MKALYYTLILLFNCLNLFAQDNKNWTGKQLMPPAELAATIKAGIDVPVIISVGPGAPIPGSLNVGMVNTKQGLDKLKSTLAGIQKNARVVIYCGCCPYEHCPNIRPALNILKTNKFKDYFLLDLPKNVKTDWMDKGYPVVKQ